MDNKSIKKLEADLWESADLLRAGSKLTSQQYCMPVLGLLFLRYAYSRFKKAEEEILKDRPVRNGHVMPVEASDFAEKSALYLPKEAQYSYLVNLPEDIKAANIVAENGQQMNSLGEVVNHAMELVEAQSEQLAGVLPKEYTNFADDLLAELLRIFNNNALDDVGGDVIGRIYEYFLSKFAPAVASDDGVFFTPKSLVKMIVNILEPTSGVLADPAVGTGTFLYRIISTVYEEYKKKTRLSGEAFNKNWTKYIKEKLLPRLYGYEFMMAPYAIAHMKIAMKLKETGYEFPADSRLQIFLANSLIEGKRDIENENDPLELENVLAESIRRTGKINVVIGSPPFRADSKNQNEWIMSLMEDYKREPKSAEKLKERNPKLINDDYVKFIRLAEDIVKDQNNAIIAYIIPASYASNLTFRGMRWNLLKQFSEIYILDLHGNVMGREVVDSTERDENILDIQLGVCVSFFVKKGGENVDFAKVFYSDFCGSRERKYRFLLNAKFEDIQWTAVVPKEPYYFFKPVDFSQADEYNAGVSLADLFPAFLGGVKTHDDGNLISFDPFNTGYDYLYEYRPFDIRHINYDRRKVSRDRYDIMRHMIGYKNYGLVMDRQVVTDNWSHIQVVKHMIDNRIHYSNRGIPVLCPMFLYEDGVAKPNVNSEIVSVFSKQTGLSFSESLVESDIEFDMMDLFDYTYGILNSPLYIEKYIDLLKIEFPKIPIPNGNEMFLRIAAYGKQLRNIHLLEEDIGNPLDIQFEGIGDNIVSSRKLKPEGLFINRTQRFTNVTEEIWDFCYGGYHGLQKWFKDRNGMKLSESDIQHVIKVLNVFNRTIIIREDLDACLDEFGLI